MLIYTLNIFHCIFYFIIYFILSIRNLVSLVHVIQKPPVSSEHYKHIEYCFKMILYYPANLASIISKDSEQFKYNLIKSLRDSVKSAHMGLVDNSSTCAA